MSGFLFPTLKIDWQFLSLYLNRGIKVYITHISPISLSATTHSLMLTAKAVTVLYLNTREVNSTELSKTTELSTGETLGKLAERRDKVDNQPLEQALFAGFRALSGSLCFFWGFRILTENPCRASVPVLASSALSGRRLGSNTQGRHTNLCLLS